MKPSRLDRLVEQPVGFSVCSHQSSVVVSIMAGVQIVVVCVARGVPCLLERCHE